MRFLGVLTALSLSLPASALQLIKCGSSEGKTLYATFGKRIYSAPEKKTVHFPIEFTIFSDPQTLQDRIIYYNTQEALKVPLEISQTNISFSFEAKSLKSHNPVRETFYLHLISPKNQKGFQGSWITTDANGQNIQTVFTLCSAYE